MSQSVSDPVYLGPQLSVAHVALVKLHNEVARAGLYNSASSTLYSGGLDGKLYACTVREGVADALENPVEVTSVSGISALCLTASGVVVCTMDGIVFHYRNDDSIDLLQPKPQQSCRIAAVCYDEVNDTLIFSDWSAEIHVIENASIPIRKRQTSISLPMFTFTDGSQKENSCLSMATRDGLLIAGFASGEIRVYDIDTLVTISSFDCSLITLRAHHRPVRSIELVDVVLLKRLAPRILSSRFPEKIMPLFFSTGNDGSVFFHYPESLTLYRSHKLSSAQLTDQYLFRAKLFTLGTVDKPRVYLAVGGCDLQLYIYDCTLLLSTALTGSLIVNQTLPSSEPINSLLRASFPVSADVWDISVVHLSTSSDTVHLILSLESGELHALQVVSGALSASQQVATMAFIRERFGPSVLIPSSRVTGAHNSFVPPKNVYCKSPSDLPRDTGNKSTQSLAGRIAVVLRKEAPAIYIYVNRSWVFCGLVKQNTPAMEGDKKADSTGKLWDLALPVQNDQTGGSYTLFMNIDEDPWVVAERFILGTNIIETDRNDINYYKRQIYDFIVSNIPKTDVLPVFQAGWEDPTNYSLQIRPETGYTTCLIDRSTGTSIEKPAPKEITEELLKKCVTLLTNSSEQNLQYALFLNDIGSTTLWLQNTDCMKLLSVRFTILLQDIQKSSTSHIGVSQETWKLLGAHFVVLSYIFLNFSNSTPVINLYKAVLLLLRGTSLSSIYTQLATGTLAEKTVGVFFFRFISALILFEDTAMADVFVWFSDLVDAAHGPVLGQFITQEDHQYLEHVCEHATNRLAGQRIGAFLSSLSGRIGTDP